jgi:hypothetical protein
VAREAPMKRERVASAGRCMMKDKTTETVDMKGYRDRCMKEWMKAGKKLLLDGPTNNNQNEQLLQIYAEFEWRSLVVWSVVCVMPSSARNTTRIVICAKSL